MSWMQQVEFGGRTFEFEVRGLKSFHEYIFWLKTCTLEGCTSSERKLQRTLSAPPANQPPPEVLLPYPDQVSDQLNFIQKSIFKFSANLGCKLGASFKSKWKDLTL